MLNGISWEDFFLCLGAVLILYYACVLAIYRPKRKHAPKPREGSTKRVWHVEEQPEGMPVPPAEHFPFMGLGADHAPLVNDGVRGVDTQSNIDSAGTPRALQSAGDDALDQAEAHLDAIMLGFEDGNDAEALLNVLRDAIQHNPVLTHHAYKGILARLIVQKAWVLKRIELSDEQVRQLWS